jgi:predicted nucleotidyltransferase
MEESQRQALYRYFADHPEKGVAALYLFGSHAENRVHQESDIDLAVLLDWQRHPTREKRFEVRVRLGSELIAVLNHNEVDLVILNDVPPLFGRRIVTEGLRLFLGDREADHAYVRDIQLQAADLEPWLRRMEKLKLEALAR